MNKLRKIIILTVGVLLLAACHESAGQSESSAEQNGEDIVQLVHEYSTGDFEDVSASITSNELIVTNADGEEKIYELPENQFFLSIAPYIDETHPCTNHSLTGCQGEMPNELFDVEITDSDGDIVIAETMETLDNGFIDLWLPRNDDYEVFITYEGKTAEAILSTYDGDQTCITTMQLEDSSEEI